MNESETWRLSPLPIYAFYTFSTLRRKCFTEDPDPPAIRKRGVQLVGMVSGSFRISNGVMLSSFYLFSSTEVLFTSYQY